MRSILACLLAISAFAAPAAAAQSPSREALEASLQTRQDLRAVV